MPKLKGEYLERYQAWRAEVAANNGVTRRDALELQPAGHAADHAAGAVPVRVPVHARAG